MRFTAIILTTVSFLSLCSTSFSQNKEAIVVGTGSVNAMAYPIMKSICQTYNKYNLNKSAVCSVVSTGGSEDNLDGIFSKKYSAGVIKADMGYNAYNGIGVFNGKPYRDLRSLFGLHNEYLTMLVSNKSGIKSFNDFKGKRVYIGNKGSGSRILVDRLFSKAGWKSDDFAAIHEEATDKIHDLFCDNKVDAAIYLIGHPNNIFEKTLAECNVKMVSFSRKEIENYVDNFRHIYPAIIKKGTYAGQKYNVDTFSSQLLLTADSNLDEETVYNFVKIVVDHYREIQENNPALKDVQLFSREVNAIPLHKGAVRFYNNFKNN